MIRSESRRVLRLNVRYFVMKGLLSWEEQGNVEAGTEGSWLEAFEVELRAHK